MKATIYHNPRCSKSRQTLALLEEHGSEITVIEYLQTPPDAAQLSTLLGKLGLSSLQLMRTGEAEYKSADDQLAGMNEAARIAWLAQNPQVIERPIVVTGKGARIGRPPETVLEIL